MGTSTTPRKRTVGKFRRPLFFGGGAPSLKNSVYWSLNVSRCRTHLSRTSPDSSAAPTKIRKAMISAATASYFAARSKPVCDAPTAVRAPSKEIRGRSSTHRTAVTVSPKSRCDLSDRLQHSDKTNSALREISPLDSDSWEPPLLKVPSGYISCPGFVRPKHAQAKRN